VKHASLLGLAPLALYLGAFTLVPVVSTLVLSFPRLKASGGLGLFALSQRITSSATPW